MFHVYVQVIGFLQLGFQPPTLVMEQGEEMTGHVNITIPGDLSVLVGASLHVCCADENVIFMPYHKSTFITQV